MYKIEIIEAGNFYADGGAMFGAVPKRAWSRRYPSDENNLCLMTMRCVLATCGKRLILVDVGMGDKYLDKVKYYQPHNLVPIKDSLVKCGYSLSNITDVILTHLHFDHCGYSTSYADGHIVPTFPNAKYWISRRQWNTLENPNRLEKDSIFEEDIRPLLEHNQLHIIKEDSVLYDGVEVRLYDGHTAGQLVVYFDTDEGMVVFPGDLIPTSSHLSPDWISAYDINALVSVNEKVRFLQEAAKHKYKLIYCHDAYTISSKVRKSGDLFLVEK